MTDSSQSRVFLFSDEKHFQQQHKVPKTYLENRTQQPLNSFKYHRKELQQTVHVLVHLSLQAWIAEPEY